jgi:protein required for attachment to host cells
MSKLKIGHGEWVVVCDGRKALILENIGDRQSPNLRMAEIREHSNAPTHVQGTDSPGRVHASFGTARSSVEQTDWHDEAERAFLHSLASYLDAAIRAGKTKALIVVAAPRALGMLREAYTAPIREAIHEEVDKDLVKTPILEIEKRLFC